MEARQLYEGSIEVVDFGGEEVLAARVLEPGSERVFAPRGFAFCPGEVLFRDEDSDTDWLVGLAHLGDPGRVIGIEPSPWWEWTGYVFKCSEFEYPGQESVRLYVRENPSALWLNGGDEEKAGWAWRAMRLDSQGVDAGDCRVQAGFPDRKSAMRAAGAWARARLAMIAAGVAEV